MSTQVSMIASPPLVRFYDPQTQGKDSKGRTLISILAWSDDELEYCHDYIQTLFPLPEGSPFNYSAPIIDRETFDAFRSRPALRARLRKSFERMLEFYGFRYRLTPTEGDGLKIVPGNNFRQASKNWVKKFNHNHLRITRILRSLRVLGLEGVAEDFYQTLRKVYDGQAEYQGLGGVISGKSMMYWGRAARRPLFIAPEDDHDDGGGQDFLYEFEQSRLERSVVGAAGLGGDGDEKSAAKDRKE